MRRHYQGFTLIELMVVVAIIGLLMASMYAYMDKDITAGDTARDLVAQLSEANRKAVAGGPIRDEVARANNLTWRTRVRISRQNDSQIIVVERAVEDAPPATTYEIQPLLTETISNDIEIFGYATSAQVTKGSVTPIPIGSGDILVHCRPDGTCGREKDVNGMADPQTLYIRTKNANGNTKGGSGYARVVVMPLNGAPLALAGW